MKLDKETIDALACPPGRRDMLVMDSDLKGFALRVTKDGTKTFLFQYRLGTVVKRLRLGRYGDLTPKQARKLAEVARGDVSAGRDPAGARRATVEADVAARAERKRKAAADEVTLEKLIDAWAEKKLRAARPTYQREAPKTMRRVFARLLDLPAHSIEPSMIRKALDAIIKPVKPPASARPSEAKNAGKGSSTLPAKGGRPVSAPPVVQMQGETMARRTRVYGHACYNWAMKRGLVPSNPFALVSVEGGDVKRDRVLTDDEAGEVWRAAGQLGWPWGPYFRLLLLTLQREVETAGMQWSELAPDRTSWTMPGARTKNGKAHLVHLAEPARAILASMPRRAGSDLVFTTTGKTPVSGFGNAKERLVAKILEERAAWAAALGAEPAALVPWRIHDFRRTGVTALAGLGTRWEVADRLLNHVTGAISGIAAIYQRHEFLDERRAAMEQWAAHVLAIAKAGEDRHQAELAAPRTAATSMGQTIVGAVAGADGAPNHATDELQQMQGAEARAPIAVSELLPGHFMDRLLAGDSPVRVWRMHRGMNGRQLAEAAGISASYLSEIENSRKPCSSAALLAIATVLRVRVQTLLG